MKVFFVQIAQHYYQAGNRGPKQMLNSALQETRIVTSGIKSKEQRNESKQKQSLSKEKIKVQTTLWPHCSNNLALIN